MALPAYSILVPNHNYAAYIQETIHSALSQDVSDLEIVVCDNASTDDSVAKVREFTDPRVRLYVNMCNVGFAANLERVAGYAKGRRMILLSSDDRMRPAALNTYAALEHALGEAAERAVWGSVTTIVDKSGRATGLIEADEKLWYEAVVDERLSAVVGQRVRRMPAERLLRKSLLLLRTPLPFASTCYARALHDAVGGYASGRLMNPDKWFLWKLLARAENAYMIDAPLFDYRVHGAGQARQEQQSGALKHLTDEYIATFNLPPEVLARAGVNAGDLARAFMREDVVLRGMLAVAGGHRALARRGLHFGLAAYPEIARREPLVWSLRALLALGPIGTALARAARLPAERRWRASAARRK